MNFATGYINRKQLADTLDAFCHWTYQATNEYLMVVDIQVRLNSSISNFFLNNWQEQRCFTICIFSCFNLFISSLASRQSSNVNQQVQNLASTIVSTSLSTIETNHKSPLRRISTLSKCQFFRWVSDQFHRWWLVEAPGRGFLSFFNFFGTFLMVGWGLWGNVG